MSKRGRELMTRHRDVLVDMRDANWRAVHREDESSAKRLAQHDAFECAIRLVNEALDEK